MANLFQNIIGNLLCKALLKKCVKTCRKYYPACDECDFLDCPGKHGGDPQDPESWMSFCRDREKERKGAGN